MADEPVVPIAPSKPSVPKVRRWQTIGMAAGLLGFLLLAIDDVLQGPIYRLDSIVNGWVSAGNAIGYPLHALGKFGSILGSTYVVAPAVVLCAVVWWLWRERRMAAWAVIGGLTTSIAVFLLKLYFHRDRPPFPDVPHSFSFPSGHTMGATGGLGILILLGTQVHVDRQRLFGQAAASAWARGITLWILASAFVGACRILAQDHWLSDVLASMFLAVAMVCAVVRVAGIPRPRAQPPPPPEKPHPKAQAKRKARKAKP